MKNAWPQEAAERSYCEETTTPVGVVALLAIAHWSPAQLPLSALKNFAQDSRPGVCASDCCSPRLSGESPYGRKSNAWHRGVIETLATRVRKVADKEGREYSLRVRPSRTTDNKIDGAVITLVDLKGKKKSYVGKTPNAAKQGWPRK